MPAPQAYLLFSYDIVRFFFNIIFRNDPQMFYKEFYYKEKRYHRKFRIYHHRQEFVREYFCRTVISPYSIVKKVMYYPLYENRSLIKNLNSSDVTRQHHKSIIPLSPISVPCAVSSSNPAIQPQTAASNGSSKTAMHIAVGITNSTALQWKAVVVI